MWKYLRDCLRLLSILEACSSAYGCLLLVAWVYLWVSLWFIFGLLFDELLDFELFFIE